LLDVFFIRQSAFQWEPTELLLFSLACFFDANIIQNRTEASMDLSFHVPLQINDVFHWKMQSLVTMLIADVDYICSNIPATQMSLPTLLEHPSSPGRRGVHVAQSLVFCLLFYLPLFFVFVSFFFVVIVLSGLRFTASDYPFGMIKLFVLMRTK